MRYIFIVILSSLAYITSAQKITISGYVVDSETGEPLIGAAIFDTISKQGATSNAFGFYSLTISSNRLFIITSYLGYESQNQEVNSKNNLELNFSLKERRSNLHEVVITGDKDEVQKEVESTQMSVFKINPQEVALIPSLGGEVDLIKVVQLLPGVARGGEGTTGMYVRGGTDDQNLIILDDATVYNLSHLFGFFSVFNNDAIRDVTLYKGGFPAQLGGRLSSVLDVRMDEGSLEKTIVNGGVGLLSSRLAISGPIISKKMGFMISARRTYIDKVFKLVNLPLPYYFYDFNGKINYKISNRDRIYVSGYLGNDILKFDGSDIEINLDSGDVQQTFGFGFDLGNITSTVRWNHIYPNQKVFSNITFIQTRFKYNIEGRYAGNNILIKSQIQDFGLKAEWDYSPNPKHKINFGSSVINHAFRPNIVNTSGDISDYLKNQPGQLLLTQEMAVYANDDYVVNEKLGLNYGLRISSCLTNSKLFGGLEPRVSMKYALSKPSSIKLSYSRMKQYMHRVSSSSVVLPTDLWYPVTKSIVPQSSNQIAVGYFLAMEKIKSNFSVESYYKTMNNLIEYREGAQLLLNNNFESELLKGKGESYGFEFLFRKKAGAFKGWVAYTLSWSKRYFPELNKGNTYYAKYDRRHVLSYVGMLQLSERITIATVWEYMTGARFTAQNGQYLMPNSSYTGVETIPIYTDRNAIVMSPSHRLDINLVIKGKNKHWWRGEWQFGVYNFYNRATPFRVNIQLTSYGYRYEQPGIFGSIPSISYNFKF